MKSYKQELKDKYVGKRVRYNGVVYTVLDVDSNCFLLIDKRSRFCETTAIHSYEASLI